MGHATHEITYDEAQAWQIAKTASWKDILLLIPFYEGHPPFWHLLLAGPAKLGLSWHTVYAILGMGCMIASGLLLFFKAPFPRWVLCLLPFNFFLFYQYGIIVRPYALMMLLMKHQKKMLMSTPKRIIRRLKQKKEKKNAEQKTLKRFWDPKASARKSSAKGLKLKQNPNALEKLLLQKSL